MSELFLESESQIFETYTSNATIKLIDACASFLESCGEDGGNCITEKTKDSLLDKFKKFIADIVASLQNLKSSIQTKVSSKVREASFQMKLKKFQEELKSQKENGIRKIEMIDVEDLCSSYCDMVDDLQKTMKKLSKMNYKSIERIDADLDDFYKTVDVYEKELDGIMNKKKKFPIDVVLKFVNSELSGNSDTMKTLNDSITVFKQMENDVHLIETREAILGPVLITRHVGLIRRIINKFNAFIKKWTVRIISSVVFLFA